MDCRIYSQQLYFYLTTVLAEVIQKPPHRQAVHVARHLSNSLLMTENIIINLTFKVIESRKYAYRKDKQRSDYQATVIGRHRRLTAPC